MAVTFIEPTDGSLMGRNAIIVSQFDGNNNDPDDISAVPIAALLTYVGGHAGKSHFFFGNNLAEPNNATQLQKLRQSAAFTARLGIRTHDYQANISGCTGELVALLNSGKKVLCIEGGPMEAIYRAMTKTSEANQHNITLVSHSSWNENRAVKTRSGVTQARTWAALKRDFPEATYIDISDQNAGFRSAGWSWMDKASYPLLKEARTLMRNAGAKTDDPSDAGMHWFALTGKQDGTPQDVKVYLEARLTDGGASGPAPAPAPAEPTFSLSNTVIPAGAPVGTVVGRFEGGNLQGDPNFSVVLESGAGSTDNAYFTIGGGRELVLAKRADKNSYSIRTEVRDGTARLDRIFPLSVAGAKPAPEPQPQPGPAPEEPASDGAYVAQGGVFVIEVESAAPAGSWKLETDKSGYTGRAYYAWRGANQFTKPGVGTLSYVIHVDEPGTYKLDIRGRRDKDGRTVANDLENDVWVRMDGSPWKKLVQAGVAWNVWGKWIWAQTFDHNHTQSPAQYILTAGKHTLSISGRSQNYKIDRIVLYRSGVSAATAQTVGRPESEKQ